MYVIFFNSSEEEHLEPYWQCCYTSFTSSTLAPRFFFQFSTELQFTKNTNTKKSWRKDLSDFCSCPNWSNQRFWKIFLRLYLVFVRRFLKLGIDRIYEIKTPNSSHLSWICWKFFNVALMGACNWYAKLRCFTDLECQTYCWAVDGPWIKPVVSWLRFGGTWRTSHQVTESICLLSQRISSCLDLPS